MILLSKKFTPILFDFLTKPLSFTALKKDLISSITLAMLSIPLFVELGIAFGGTPEQGLITGIISGIVLAFLTGSNVQMCGPSATIILIVKNILTSHGFESLVICMIFGSVFLILFGMLKIAYWIKFIPISLIIGFSAGIGIVLFISQIHLFLGIHSNDIAINNSYEKLEKIFPLFSQVNYYCLAVGIVAIATIIILKKYVSKSSWAILTILILSIACFVLKLPVETIQSKYGVLPSKIASPKFPLIHFDVKLVRFYISNGFLIAITSSLESLLAAIIGRDISKVEFKPSLELVAQGASNAALLFFGGLPSMGLILLTAANARSGAQSPLALLFRSGILIIILLLLAPIVSQIPLVILASILMVISLELFHLDKFLRLLKAPTLDVVVLLTSFLFTLFTNVTVAVFVGVGLSSVLFMRQMSQRAILAPYDMNVNESPSGIEENIENKSVPSEIGIYKILGPYFFGSSSILQSVPAASIYIIEMKSVLFMDASGMIALEKFYLECSQNGISLILSSMRPSLKKDCKKFGVFECIPENSLTNDIHDAFRKAMSLYTKG